MQYLGQAEPLTIAKNTKALEELRREFNISFSRLIGEISNRKIANVRKELAKKSEETEALKSTVNELKTVQIGLQSDLSARAKPRNLSTEKDLRTNEEGLRFSAR